MYIKTNWENEPSESTPINASNLNKIENGIYDNSLGVEKIGDLTELDTTDKTSVVNAINEVNDKITGIEFYGNQTDTITITPTQDCYIKVEYMTSTWAYDGGNSTVTISNTVGNATEIYNLKADLTGGNIVARSLVAKAVYRCAKNTQYTFTGSGGAFSSTYNKWITIEVIPI